MDMLSPWGEGRSRAARRPFQPLKNEHLGARYDGSGERTNDLFNCYKRKGVHFVASKNTVVTLRAAFQRKQALQTGEISRPKAASDF